MSASLRVKGHKLEQ